MKYLLLLIVALTTATTASYASFPVTETTTAQAIENSEIFTTYNIEFVESETNLVSAPAPGIMDLHWSVRLLIGLVLGVSIMVILFYE
jgi:hypothetical protein